MLLFAGIHKGVRWVRSRMRPAERAEFAHEHDHPLAEVHDPEYEHEHEPVVVATGGRGAVAQEPHRHEHRHAAPMPDDPFVNYGTGTALGVGMIHGIGAETPTKVLIFRSSYSWPRRARGAGGRVFCSSCASCSAS